MKVRLILTHENYLDKGILVCEVDKENSFIKQNIKEFFKSSNKINIDVSLVEKNSILNDGIVIEYKRIHK